MYYYCVISHIHWSIHSVIASSIQSYTCLVQEKHNRPRETSGEKNMAARDGWEKHD